MESSLRAGTNLPLINDSLKEPTKLFRQPADYSLLINFHSRNASNVLCSTSTRIKDVDKNKISTSKYTYLNCLPKIIFEQFSKIVNVYFLIIAFLQSIKEISVSNGQPVTLFPLLLVVMINGIKDFVEDWKRKKSDDEENSRRTMIYNRERMRFEEKQWEDVKVGNILKIHDGEYFPADMVLMNSSELQGFCYVETKNLDGETNLKHKKSSLPMMEKSSNENELINFQGRLDCIDPNECIYEFQGRFVFSSNPDDSHSPKLDNTIFINKDSFLLRGCSLRQTDYIYGFVVYVGHNTKIMKNFPNARTKISRIEKIMNHQILIIFIVQFVLATIGTTFYLIWLNKFHMNLKYIFPQEEIDSQQSAIFFFYRLGTWSLIFTNLVPISLLVTIEMIKFLQGMFISWDVNIYDKNTRTMAKVQTSTLNEELGQVKYVFCDKTGTLTKNAMEFTKMSIGAYSYGNDATVIPKSLSSSSALELNDDKGTIANFNFNDPIFKRHLNDQKHENYFNIHMFLTCLATCHSVITDSKESSRIVYQASSPDERALVNCARYFKYRFSGRDMKNNLFIDIENGKTLTFQLLHHLEYSSERRRMSVIVKCPDGKIRMFIKGADNVIYKRVSINPEMVQITSQHLYSFAQTGLRTLMIAYKEISQETYESFATKYCEIMNEPFEKEKQINELYDNIEQELYLLGATGIEDKLQDNVSEVLSSFIETGIKVWVLTGDNVDTTKSIAYSSKLITHEFNLFELLNKSCTFEIQEQLISFLHQITMEGPSPNQQNMKCALVVSLDGLTQIFSLPELTESFYSLAIHCTSVLCCRVTPKQKAQIVQLVKDHQSNATTLAIGDGANDVSMITCANIGIGIMGMEGLQAARASDYSISQFQYLKRLLFVHGRESYRKNSFVVVYNFYKNIIYLVPQFWFGWVSYFSGQPLYDPWIYQFYNIFYTSLPIIWFGIYDKEVSYDILISDSRYYTQGIVGKLFHSFRFWKWVLYGMMQAGLIYIFSFLANSGPINNQGYLQDLHSSGSIAYSGIVLVANVKILLATCSHTLASLALFAFSVVSYYVTLYIMSKFLVFDNFNHFPMNFLSSDFYLSTIILVTVCMLLDIGTMQLFKLFGWIENNPLKLNQMYFECPKNISKVMDDEVKEEHMIEINNKCKLQVTL